MVLSTVVIHPPTCQPLRVLGSDPGAAHGAADETDAIPAR